MTESETTSKETRKKKTPLTDEEKKERRRLYKQRYIENKYGGDVALFKYHESQKLLHRYHNDPVYKKKCDDAKIKKYHETKPPLKHTKKRKPKNEEMEEKLRALQERSSS